VKLKIKCLQIGRMRPRWEQQVTEDVTRGRTWEETEAKKELWEGRDRRRGSAVR
jgi:hypothetical protein